MRKETILNYSFSQSQLDPLSIRGTSCSKGCHVLKFSAQLIHYHWCIHGA